MSRSKAVFNWSGGKDSALCLYKLMRQDEYEVLTLLTSISEEYNRVSMHGVRVELLGEQAKSIGLLLSEMRLSESPDMKVYNQTMKESLLHWKEQGAEVSVYGDIFLEDLKAYREEQLAKVNLRGVFPLWKMPTHQLIREFINLGFKTIVVCVNEKYLDKSFAGRIIDDSFLNDLPDTVDPCGENGEFHTFVFDGPLFKNPIAFTKGELVYKKYSTSSFESGFWFCDLLPA